MFMNTIPVGEEDEFTAVDINDLLVIVEARSLQIRPLPARVLVNICMLSFCNQFFQLKSLSFGYTVYEMSTNY